MLHYQIPGHPPLQLDHLVLDYNGTLAVDGLLLPGVAECLQRLAPMLEIHVLTADTFGSAASQLASLPCTLSVLAPGAQDQAKLAAVQALGSQRCACIGNGRNDRLMLQRAALGIVVIQGEGAAVETLLAAQVVCTGIVDALGLLLEPDRLRATLRC